MQTLKILLVKTSSLGDILHTFPLLADLNLYAQTLNYQLQVDWLMEQCFMDIAVLHEFVGKQVHLIPTNMRTWKKKWFSKTARQERKNLAQQLQERQTQQAYDLIIDAQGLLKSVYFAKVAQKINTLKVNTLKVNTLHKKHQFHGYDAKSVREPLASWFYDYKHYVSKELHAVDRTRLLGLHALETFRKNQLDKNQELNFSEKSFELTLPDIAVPLKKLTPPIIEYQGQSQPYVLFFHGTSQLKKYWPIDEWIALAEYFINQGQMIVLPWANESEKQQANAIASGVSDSLKNHVIILDKMPLSALFPYIYGATQVISVDTGLGHLSTLICPTILIFGVTNPEKVGAYCYNNTSYSFNLGNQYGFPKAQEVINALKLASQIGHFK